MQPEDQIRSELQEVLSQNPQDYGRILELSSKLASFDKTNVRFTVDAGVIDRLGKELVARHETAVSELVKNAYDADATNVELSFEDTDDYYGTLTVDDNGNGMTKEQLINGFMRISSSDKLHNPVSPIYKRKRAGKKGIGRFATQRLGEKLTIITQALDSNFAYKVEVNWDDFKIDSELIIISNLILEVPKTKEKGTTLIIEGLREWWSIAAIKRVYKYSLDVIQPFPLSKEKNASEIDPGFLVRCFRSINNNLEEIADEESMIYEHALAEISGNVNEKGIGTWKFDSKKLEASDSGTIYKEKSEQNNTDNSEHTVVAFDYLRTVHFKAYYFIYNIGMIPRMIQGYIQEKAKASGGFRLYRNGFRVLPYGEPQNDWLGLDESVRRRVILPAHGNNNFFGFVEINDPDGKVFNELSSREGLFKNEAFDELVSFIYRSILAVVLRIAEIREKKLTTGQKNWSKDEKKTSETINDVADALDQFAKAFEQGPDNSESGNSDHSTNSDNTDEKSNYSRAEQFRLLSDKLRSAAESIEEIGMLRVLAGLGLTIGEFTHEIKQYLPAFDVDSDFLINNLNQSTEEYRRAERLKTSFKSFSTYASYFDKTVSQNVQRELHPIELRDAINSFLNVIAPDIDRNGFNIKAEYSGYDLFTCKMHPSEWASILFNLYSNSKKAIKRAKREGKILIKAGIFEEKVFIEFNDTGDGIPKGNEERIFRAFFTTSTQKGHDATSEEELVGTGLGLKIVKDIIDSYAGEIYLTKAEPGYVTCFTIVLPRATEEEIAKYDI